MQSSFVWACVVGVCAAGTCWQASALDDADVAWILAVVRHGARRVAGKIEALLASVVPQMRTQSSDTRARLSDVSEMIDVVRLGLTAGLSFDAALELYCANRETVLAQRMKRAELAWRTGMGTREEELMGVSQAMGVRALESFAIAVSQALTLGAPLADVLASQAREIRAARRSAIEREIERAPVKLLIPTGTLILPALLLSILGPLLAASGMM